MHENQTSKSKIWVLIITCKWDGRFSMYVLGTVYCLQIHRSRIRCLVLSVVRVQKGFVYTRVDVNGEWPCLSSGDRNKPGRLKSWGLLATDFFTTPWGIEKSWDKPKSSKSEQSPSSVHWVWAKLKLWRLSSQVSASFQNCLLCQKLSSNELQV